MSFDADELEEGAAAARPGSSDFGILLLPRGARATVDALNAEADLNEMGQRHPACEMQQRC